MTDGCSSGRMRLIRDSLSWFCIFICFASIPDVGLNLFFGCIIVTHRVYLFAFQWCFIVNIISSSSTFDSGCGCVNDGGCCSPGIQKISAVIAIVFRMIASIMNIKE